MKVHDKYIIEIEEVIRGYGNPDRDDPFNVSRPLARIKGFRTLVFDEEGLSRLVKVENADNEVNLADRIRCRMEMFELSQEELADRCGVTEVSMSRYVNGSRTPKATMLLKIAKALHTTPNWLLGVDE